MAPYEITIHLVYTQGVTGSNPVSPTKVWKSHDDEIVMAF